MFSQEVFEEAFEKKKQELFDLAIQLGVISISITGVGVINIQREVETLNAQEVFQKNQEKAQETFMAIPELPTLSHTALEFKAYYETYKAAFDEAQRISNLYPDATSSGEEKVLGDAAREKLILRPQFKVNYEAKKEQDCNKIEDFKNRIEATSIDNVDETNFIERRRQLETIAEEHIKLGKEILE